MSQYPTNPTGAPGTPAGSGQLVLIGFAVAIVAVILMNVYVEMRVAAQDENKVMFFEFVDNVEAGTTISPKHINPIMVPEKYIKALGQDAIRENQQKAGTPADGVGYPLNVSVVKGEFLRANQFGDQNRRIIRSDPEKGQRQIAISLESDEQPANLTPGDRVDLLGQIGSGYETIMEYVEVAAVGQRQVENSDTGRSSRYGSITINLAPAQAKLLLAVKSKLPDEQFRVAKRNPDDTSTPEIGDDSVVNPKVLTLLRIAGE